MGKHYKARGNIYEDVVGDRISYKVVYKGTTKRFREKIEAKKYLAELVIKDIDRTSSGQDVSYTFTDMCEMLVKYLKRERKFSTYTTKKDILDKIIIPNFKDKPISEVTKLDCMTFRDWLADTEYSTTYKNSVLTIFKQVFNYADEYYDIENKYARKLKKYRKTEQEKIADEEKVEDVWSPEEFQRFMFKVKSRFYGLFFTLSITAWTRLGETSALRWNHYDGSEIHVHRNIIKVRKEVDPNCFKDVSVKTKKGNRYIKLPQSVCKLLDELKSQQEKIPGFKEDWYIFNRWNGNKYPDGYIPQSRTTIYRRFDEAIAASGVRKIRIHDLRHSGATYAIISGEDIKAVSERLGHEDIETTLKVYHHAINKTKSKLMENTDDFARICQKD